MILLDDRIRLISFSEVNKEEIKETYLKWLNDKEVVSSIGSLELLLPKDDDFINQSFIRFTAQNTLGFFIQIENQYIGTAKIDKINQHNQSAEIGIMIGEKGFWGKGIATDVYTILLDYSFNILKLHRVWGGCIVNNVGMKNVFIRTGFTQEAYLRESVNLSLPDAVEQVYTDSLLFSILQKEYKSKKNER